MNRMISYDLLKWILANEDRKDITIGFPDTDISMFLIPWDERSQVKTSWEEEGDYIVYTYLFRTGNEYDIDGYSEVYHIDVDGFKIGSVYKKEEG